MHARDRMIEELTADNEKMRSELSRVKRDLEKTSAKLKDQEEILDQCQERIAALIVENDATKTELEWKMEDLTRSRTRLEEEVCNLRKKVQSLQVELDNSEAVQRDFVKLSQSLQVCPSLSLTFILKRILFLPIRFNWRKSDRRTPKSAGSMRMM